jgi:uncharacterized protein YggU (UPF0235/DUF167 family)
MFVKVVATPGARKERITKVKETEFHIAVREPAERNRANKRILAILAEEYGISVAHVRLLTGHRSRAKMVVVDV